MGKDFEGKVAIVTGGTSGIGRETSVAFAKAGAKVVVAGRRDAEGAETVDLIRKAGGDGLFVGRLDVAFNNAGIEGVVAPIISQTEKDFDHTMEVNVKGVWLCLRYEIRQMLKQASGGAIVNMSSIIGLMGWAGVAAYSASKHAVIGLTKAAALENAKHHIRVNAVCPAVVETPMGERQFGAPAIKKYATSLHPLGRFGAPAEIASAVLWMCSDGAAFMTGQSLVLDGGFLAGPNPPG
jgi:NAD(P)-dependent dehydrogenase (short-subunit alcohol dehydrogenase family)